jgi:hypothetical protein
MCSTLAGALTVSCSDDRSAGVTSSAVTTLPPALASLLASTSGWPALGIDTIEVWVCQVPLDTSDPTYHAGPLRLPLTPEGLAQTLNRFVTPYFVRLSHSLYHPVFVAGQRYAMAPGDAPQACVDDALRHSERASNAVLAVADAEHTATVLGGFGIVGSACPAATRASCPAASTGRAAYVGASDFNPVWGDEPAVDLEEHEIGHLLGWPHSGSADGGGHDSALDVMSDSAAPRDVDPTRRDGPDTLAVNRIAARWLPLRDVAVLAGGSVTMALSPSSAGAGTRAVVLTVDDHRFLTVEFLADQGFDDFLPRSGIAVHLVDMSSLSRSQVTEVGTAPFLDMLTDPGTSWAGHLWTVRLVALTGGDRPTAVVHIAHVGAQGVSKRLSRRLATTRPSRPIAAR